MLVALLLQISIAGTVTATDGTPLSGVRVQIVETGRHTFSDSAGRYMLDSASTGIVEFSLRGRRSVQQCLEARAIVDVTMELDERGWWRRFRAGAPIRVATTERQFVGAFGGIRRERVLVTAASLDSIPIHKVQTVWRRGSAWERGARIGSSVGALSMTLMALERIRRENCVCSTSDNVFFIVGFASLGASAGALVGGFVGNAFRGWVKVHQ